MELSHLDHTPKGTGGATAPGLPHVLDAWSSSLLAGHHQDHMPAGPLATLSDRLPASIELLLPLTAIEELDLTWGAPQYRHHPITVRRPSSGFPFHDPEFDIQ